MKTVLTLVMLCSLSVCGCMDSLTRLGLSEPVTNELQMERGLFGAKLKFANTKDNSIEVEEAGYNTDTHQFTLKGLQFSSDTAKAYAGQGERGVALLPWGQMQIDFQRQLGQNAVAIIDAAGRLVPLAFPQGIVPNGLQALTYAKQGLPLNAGMDWPLTDEQLQALSDQLQEEINKRGEAASALAAVIADIQGRLESIEAQLSDGEEAPVEDNDGG